MPPAIEWPPKPGYFRMRLVPKGWAVPVAVLHTDDLWHVTIDGIPAAPPHTDPLLAGCYRVWERRCQRIDETEYRYLLALKAAALRAQPDHPACHPDKPIVPATLRPIIPTEDTPR